MKQLFDFPWWYAAVTFALVAFHVGRGMIGQTRRISDNPFNPHAIKPMHRWQAIWLLYAHDFLLHLLCTVFGAVCLLLAYRLAQAPSPTELAGLTLLAVVGVAGVTGQLAVALSLGKFPQG